MLELKNISFQYGDDAGKTEELSDITISVAKGDMAVITGESGCGKTTLARVLNGLCPNFYEGTLSGEYRINGKDSKKQSIGETGLLIGSVFQDPRTQFFATNSTDELVLAMRHPGALSGGQKQRVLLAAAILSGKRLLILDEPTSSLDGRNMRELAYLIRDIARTGTAVLLITHDLEFAELAGDSEVRIEDGRTREKRVIVK